jgi:hypothetical protein
MEIINGRKGVKKKEKRMAEEHLHAGGYGELEKGRRHFGGRLALELGTEQKVARGGGANTTVSRGNHGMK